MSRNMNKVIKILDEYKICGRERRELLKIIKPIYLHPKFQERFSDEYPHHGNISISEHVIEDAIKTYLLAKVYAMEHPRSDFSVEVAVYIALFHDLYTVPYQNNKVAKVNRFRNVHGFRHPIEAVINSYCWYLDVYKENANKIIDGIIHHMCPFPVISVTESNENELELKNYDLYQKLPDDVKKMMIDSTKRGRIGCFSFARSKYKEGQIVSRADKYVSIKQLKNIYDWVALITGENKGLTK